MLEREIREAKELAAKNDEMKRLVAVQVLISLSLSLSLSLTHTHTHTHTHNYAFSSVRL